MSRILEKIYKRANSNFSKAFKKPITVKGNLRSVTRNDPGSKSNVLVIQSGDYFLECMTSERVDTLNIGSIIKVTGTLQLGSTYSNKLVMVVTNLYPISMETEREELFNTYYNLMKIVLSEKCRQRAKPLMSRMPKFINEIGVIHVQDDHLNVQNFKMSFTEKCSGRAYFYPLDESLHIRSALQHFASIQRVQLIVLLINNLSFQQTCIISAKENLNALLARKNTPYIVAVRTVHDHCTDIIVKNDDKETSEAVVQVFPLLAPIVEKEVIGLPLVIDLIHDIQLAFRTKIQNNLASVRDCLQKSLDDRQKQLDYLALQIDKRLIPLDAFEEFLENRSRPKSNPELHLKLARTYHVLNMHLDMLALRFESIKSKFMANVMDDLQAFEVHNALIAKEDKINQQKQQALTFASAIAEAVNSEIQKS